MKHQAPSEEQVRTAIRAVFDRCQGEQPDRVFSALVAIAQKPLSKENPQIHSQTPDYFDREMDEICEFSNRMNQFIRLLPKSGLPEEWKTWYGATLRTMVYCHVTEADLPYLILLNLLRVLCRKDCCFTFHKRNDDDTVKMNDAGRRKQCLFPRDKVKEIHRQDKEVGTGVGKVLHGLLYSNYRNAFAHSQYTVDRKGSVVLTGSLTGMAPETIADSTKMLDLLMPEDIEALYLAANSYLQTFIESYKVAIKRFHDGEFHKHELSGKPIRWDATRQQWTWNAR